MNEVVKIHNDLTNEKLGKMGANELDLFMAIAYKMRDKGTDEVIISFAEIRALSSYSATANNSLVADLVKANKHLLEFQFIVEKGSKIYQRTLFKEFVTDTEQCTLTVAVWDETRYILNDLSRNFTRFELDEFVNLESKYSKRLYKLLKQFRTQGFYYSKKEEFYRDMDVPDTYKNADFNKRVLKPALEECKKYIPGLRLEVIKSGRGAKVHAYVFWFDKEKTDADPEHEPTPTATPKTKKSKNKFNDFHQNDYNFDDLEKSLLSN